MRVAVAGGTGVVGRHVVEALEAGGHRAVAMARSRDVDLVTGAGLDGALEGAEAVIDVANVSTTSRKAAEAFFETAGRNLLAAAERAGVRHVVTLSIVGIDRVDMGYYQGKLRQEEVLKAGPVPWTVLRATQFHEFAEQVLALVPGPVTVVPRMRSQPIAAREVAAALTGLAVGAPQGMAPEIAGPRVESMPEMVRGLLRARGVRRRVLSLPMPGAVGKALASGGLLPAGSGPRGTQTFDEWLEAEGAKAAPGSASST